MLSGGDMLIRALKDEGVEVVFGYPGGAALHIYDAIFRQSDVKHILVRHEQAATHAADGYSRATGKVGTVLVTSGPGAMSQGRVPSWCLPRQEFGQNFRRCPVGHKCAKLSSKRHQFCSCTVRAELGDRSDCEINTGHAAAAGV